MALERSGSPGAAIFAWLFSGALVMTASLCYAELGAAMPTAGGDYDYLTAAYGDYAGFSFAWYYFWVSKPGSQAIIATVFGNYVVVVTRGLIIGDHSLSMTSDSKTMTTEATLLAVALVTVLFIINCLGVKTSSTINNILTVVKMLLILVLVVSGILFSVKYPHNIKSNFSLERVFDGTSASGICTGMIACLWAYEGW